MTKAEQVLELIEGKQPIVLTEDDYDEMDPKEQKRWKGYWYKMTYETWDQDSLEAGDTDDKGWTQKKSKPDNSLQELLEGNSDIYNQSWLEWSSSHPDGDHDWIVSQEDESGGENTIYHLWVVRSDGKGLSKEEMQYIHKELGLHGRI